MTLHRLLLDLDRRGVKTTVIRPRQALEKPNTFPYQEHLVTGIPIPTYPQLRFGLSTPGRLKRIWQADRPSLVHIATEGPLGLSALRAAKSLKIPVISTFHTNFHQYGDYYRYSFLIKPVLHYLKYLHNRTEATYAPSDDLIANLKTAGFKNLRKLGRGVDRRLFHPDKRSEALRKSWGADEDTPVFAYTGRIAAEKNIPFAIACFNKVREQIPEARMVLIGDGPQRRKLEAAGHPVIFCGAQHGESLAEHYASADFFLFPSITETFGNVIAEAMASGLIVACYDYAAGRLLIQHGKNGILAAFNDEAAYLSGIEAFIKERNRWPEVRQMARESVESMTWEEVFDDYLESLRDYL